MVDNLLDVGVEGDLNDTSGDPVLRVGELVDGFDEGEEGTDGALSDTLVVVVQKLNENLNSLLDVRHEGLLGSLEQLSDSVGGDLLLDGDSAVDVGEHLLVKVEISLVLDVLLVVRTSGRRARTSGKGLGGGLRGLSVLDELVRVLALLARGNESRNDLRQVGRKLALEDLSHDTEEDEAGLSKTGVVHGESLEGGLHELVEVRVEDLGADGVRDRTDSVGSDTSEIELLVGSLQSKEGYQSLNGLVEVGLKLLLGGVGSRANGTGDGDLDGDLATFQEDKESLHEEGQVVDNVVTQNLEVRVETSASLPLGSIVNDEVEEDGNDRLVLGSALLGEPLAETAESDTGSSSNDNLGVLETSLDDRPELVDMGSDVVGATLDNNTEGHEGRLAHVGVARGHVDLELGGEDGEDLLRGQRLGEGVETSEGKS
jgi:hypothetical protein